VGGGRWEHSYFKAFDWTQYCVVQDESSIFLIQTFLNVSYLLERNV